MNKILLYLILTGTILIGCSQEKTVQQQIAEKEAEVHKLEKEIKDLRKQLPDSVTNKAAVPVRLKDMEGEVFKHYIIAFGEVEAADYAMISPEMGGQITKIHVDEGQKVGKGTLLVSLNTSSIENSIQQVKANLELAQQTFTKQERLWEQKIGSEIQYLQAKSQKESLEAQLESLKAQKRMSQIHAPFAGYVNKIFQKQGELASQMAPIVEMVNLEKLTASADISEKYLGDIKKGQMVEVTFEPYPNIKLEVPISRVSKVIAPQSRTFEIEIEFPNQGEKFKPNMVSTISINDHTSKNAFVVPSIIVKQDINGRYIFKAEKVNNSLRAKKAYIETGLSYGEETMITKGISKGDRIIIDGYNLVNTGIPVIVK